MVRQFKVFPSFKKVVINLTQVGIKVSELIYEHLHKVSKVV